MWDRTGFGYVGFDSMGGAMSDLPISKQLSPSFLANIKWYRLRVRVSYDPAI